MTRPFLPPPDPKRCCAAKWCGYYNARCPARRATGSDVCETHRAAESKGQRVARVKPARRTNG